MQNTLVADVKFLLKDSHAADTTLVSLVCRYENKRFFYSTGQFIEPYQWDAPNQQNHAGNISDYQRSRATQNTHY